MEVLRDLGGILLTTVLDVLPIVAILLGFQIFVLRGAVPNLKNVLLGFVYVLVGLVFFLEGLELALFPLGKLMAQQLTDPGFIAGLHGAGYPRADRGGGAIRGQSRFGDRPSNRCGRCRRCHGPSGLIA